MKYLICLFALISSLSAKDHIAVYHLSDISGEVLGEPGLADFMNPEQAPKLYYFNFLSCLSHCATKPNLKAVIIYPENHRLGMAQRQEISRRLQEIQAAGKKVYLYAHGLDNSTLPLALATESVLFPSGQVMFNGISIEQLYFKGLLDKMGMSADFIHIGDFKSAAEPFYLTGPSEASKKQKMSLYQGIYDEMIQLTQDGLKSDKENTTALTKKAFFSAQDALKHKLVNKLAFHNDFAQELKTQFPDAKFTRNYGLPQASKPPKITNMMEAIAFLQKLTAPKPKKTGPVLALTILEGNIEQQMGEALRVHILKAAKDPLVKAMVLRINSPGGSALASEVICQATEVFKNTGKPLIVSMGNVAASGGYYSAVYGEPIFAEPSTITGSIGVIGGKFVINQLKEKIGISTHSMNFGDYSNIYSTHTKFSEVQRELVKNSMLDVYSLFKKRVLDGRQQKISADFETIAGGRVYTGRQALTLGLVDKLGGLREAINEAKVQANLTKYRVDIFPKQLSLQEMIMDSFREKEKKDEDYLYSGPSKQKPSLLKNPLIQQSLSALRATDPASAQATWQFLTQVQMLQNQNILLLHPGLKQ